MGSLFQGTPQTATSYTTSNTETPKWLQDAIYNQIQMATNVANTPYQPYDMPTVAELSPLQQQAYKDVQANQGAWKPEMNTVASGLESLSKAPGAAQAANPYFTSAAGMSGVNAAQPYMSSGSNFINAAGSANTASALQDAQQKYLRPELVDQNLNAGQKYWNQAGQLDVIGAAQPYLTQAGQAAADITGSAQPYLNQASSTTAQALSDKALNAANPYLQAAAQSSTANIGQYMSPYQQNAMDVIAKQGARNLQENLLPSVSDAFIKAGQFGGTRMGEFGSRALRDTQESILNQQAQMANQGYGQALSASQADLARQAQLAGTVGSISGADLSRILQGGAQYGNLAQTAGGLTAQQASALNNVGQTTGQLTSQQMQNLMNLGNMQTNAGQAQQQFGLTAAQAVQQAQAADASRQLQAGSAMGQLGQTMGNLTQGQQSALTNIGSQTGQLTNTDLARQQGALTALGNTAQLQNQMRTADTAALEAAGQAQQLQQQKQLDAAQAQYQAGVNYPKQQLDWLNTQIRGMAPSAGTSTTQAGTTTGGTYSASPLSQIASGMALYKGLTS
jgi:hypothetical protein